jgi:hypothetical protein
LFAAALLAIGYGVPAMAQTNLAANGSFAVSGATGFQFGSYFGSTGTLTGWSTNSGSYSFVFVAGNNLATSTQLNPQGAYSLSLWDQSNAGNGFTDAGATGGNFIAIDGDVGHNGAVTQTISNLRVGQTYNVSFAWAGAQQYSYTGVSVDTLKVGFGSSSVTTGPVTVASKGFSGWINQTYTFVATSSSQVLSFLATGSSAVPPFILISNVSVTVPEPASAALVASGLFAVAVLRRRRALGAPPARALSC